MFIKSKIARSVLSYVATVTFLSVVIYMSCDYYVKSVGEEIMMNWSQAESIAIQEGNLLSSITKNQRFILSSKFIRSIKLVTYQNNQVESLIEFGDQISVFLSELNQVQSRSYSERVGFFKHRVYYRIPDRNHFVVVFEVYSSFIIYAFYSLVAFGAALIGMYLFLIQQMQKRERQERESILKTALNNFFLGIHAPSLLQKEVPGLLAWWNTKRLEVERAQETLIENRSKIILGEMASRVAHDIRGPLRNIEVLTRRIEGLDQEQMSVMTESIQRIKKILETIAVQTSKAMVETQNQKPTNIVQSIRSVLDSKVIQYADLNLIKFENEFLVSDPLVRIDAVDLERSLGNLIDNAYEACEEKTRSIEITLSGHLDELRLLTKDYGKGIESADIEKMGLRGFTKGKAKGMGLGIYYAKKLIEECSGNFGVRSEMGQWTQIEITLPIFTRSAKSEIIIPKAMDLVFIDDSLLVLDMLSMTFKENRIKEHNRTFFFNSIAEFERYLEKGREFILISDFNLGNELENGFELINRYDLQNQSIVCTDAAQELRTQEISQKYKIPFIDKTEFFSTEKSFVHFSEH